MAHRDGAGNAPRYLGVQTPHHVLQAVGLLVGGVMHGLQHNLTTFHNRWGDYDYEDSSSGNSMLIYTIEKYS